MSTRRRPNRPPRDDTDDSDDDGRGAHAGQLLQSLNETTTVADLILNDSDDQKRIAMGVIGRHSAIAKTILDSIDEDESLRLGTVNTINVLKLMSDIYDNKIPVVNQ
ncbi:P12 [Agrotis ipsilon multiple nucleopolyhedrovirus]|uniref:p12 n=1 Tax=Agrotis ipsilon multiple nucleopolyhedrovirus TaxID=208013 RepID=B6D5Z1_9ABAC|nr:P12 [Agrotis ipsilon multiple nucleopolyhedrovirus]ACI28779.1 P12 [Agrotis ipsilon multiple nucleopolyhedrovirus]